MNNSKAYTRLWGLLKDKLREAKEKRELSAVAARMGVRPSAVSRWANEERGPDITLRNALDLAFALDIPMEQIVAALMPEDAEAVIRGFGHDREYMRKILTIMVEDEEGWNLIKAQIDLILSRKK